MRRKLVVAGLGRLGVDPTRTWIQSTFTPATLGIAIVYEFEWVRQLLVAICNELCCDSGYVSCRGYLGPHDFGEEEERS